LEGQITIVLETTFHERKGETGACCLSNGENRQTLPVVFSLRGPLRKYIRWRIHA